MAFDRSIRFPELVNANHGSLPDRLAEAFTSGSRNRGMNYFLQGRVVITRGTPVIVTGRVRGTRPYSFSLKYENSMLKVECECEFFHSSGACKHIWASLLAADQQTFLSSASADPLVVLVDGLGTAHPAETDDLITELRAIERGAELSISGAEFGKRVPEPRRLDWKRHVDEISRPVKTVPEYFERAVWPEKRQIRYWVDVGASRAAGEIALSLESVDRKLDGTFSRPAPLRLKRSQIGQLGRLEDRDAIAALSGGKQRFAFSLSQDQDSVPENLHLSPELARVALPLVVRTGECFLKLSYGKIATEPGPLTWDEGGAWRLTLEVRRTLQGWGVVGVLRRSVGETEERMDVTAPELVTSGGFVFFPEKVAPLAEGTPFEWLMWLRRHSMLEAPERDRDQLLEYLLCTPGLPETDIPQELAYEESKVTPRPRLRFRGMDAGTGGAARLRAALSFDYEGRIFEERAGESAYFDAASRRLVRRDTAAERDASALLEQTGMRFRGRAPGGPAETWELAPSKLPEAVRILTAAGWSVEADGKMFRAAGKLSLKVSSGLDWFDLAGGISYGEQSAELPALLAALRRGDNMVRLGDGSYGILPEEWLRRVAMVAGMGSIEDEGVRFRRSQAGLLDALLASQPEAEWDDKFAKVRDELATFTGVTSAEQPSGFQGTLRDYQKEGLGWMEFLRRFSFGGCLADDMGTGKTAQVLALLELRRADAQKEKGKPRQPSLVVVPRSLIFNWKEESIRFTPQLRILDYTGPERDARLIPGYDVVLTTYGTLRRDIAVLREIVFDYAVLDEAQMVKNSGTEGAKAVRLIRADHRLALSGTPVENHLGELWSLFEFLNPGILGSAGVFKAAGGAARNPDEGSRELLALAIRPFILRRTKEQVARELPPRTEQTIYCELGEAQRNLYNELRDHYREALLSRVATQGLAKSKIMVLEALLRLRQAACHPGLIDPAQKGEPSAKLEALVAQIREVLESGHKALVFSQFTSLLAIVRKQLDDLGIVYEYLDGKTRDRQARVERFQNDEACPLFLISLKAGGLGLNLTAADYVFLLDPWWNPAVEAQAIDRAHRIGQLRRVSAYRLIARDTVEEKVLELQKTKRDLAAAIIGESNSVIRDLKREDLELLLS